MEPSRPSVQGLYEVKGIHINMFLLHEVNLVIYLATGSL